MVMTLILVIALESYIKYDWIEMCIFITHLQIRYVTL